MRIISQDKMIDINYDMSSLYIYGFHNKFELGILNDNDEYEIVLGYYSTEEKAIKVREMIWQPRYWASSNALIKDGVFVPGFERYVFYMPKDEDVK